MPVIYIYAINTTAGRDNKLYESPIYRWSIFTDGLQQAVGLLFSLVLNYYHYYMITRKPGRTEINYIGSIDFESDTNPKHWAMRGVALLCDIK